MRVIELDLADLAKGHHVGDDLHGGFTSVFEHLLSYIKNFVRICGLETQQGAH